MEIIRNDAIAPLDDVRNGTARPASRWPDAGVIIGADRV